MALTIKHTQEGAANALALNKDNSQVVIGGRNVFKIFNIDDTEFVEIINLRVGKNLNLNFSCNDVVWNTTDDSILATAATNGAVVIWNLSKPSRSKLEHVYNDHKRTVNKVCFKPTEPTLLLSGSQDGTMKCFDLRVRDTVKTFVSGSESVRDVQFSPHQANTFTSVSENGGVQIWDMRRTDRYVQQFTAHSGPIFVCDWHPDMRWLATASRDKTIKVWDMETKPSLEFTIHTMASIGHIKWRPSRRFHIASSALVVDCNVNIWDVRRPYIPFAAFDHHKDVATGIAWRGCANVFLSTSRDGSIVQNVFSDCKRPSDFANPQGMSISGRGDIMLATRAECQPRRPRSEQFLHAHSCLYSFAPTIRRELDTFVECAKQYILIGRPLPELCDYNASVARSVGLSHVSLVWETIKVIYTYTPATDDSLFSRSDDVTLPENKVLSKVVSSCDASEEKYMRSGIDSTEVEEEIDLEENDVMHGLRPPDVQAQGDFFFGDGELDPLGVDQLEAITKFQPDWTVKAEAFDTRHEIMEGAPPEPYGDTIEAPPATEGVTVPLAVHSLPTLPVLRLHDVVVKALWYHVDMGDVQTAVAVLTVLGDRRRDLDLPIFTQTHWLLTYIDLLDRHKLFVQAAHLIQLSWIPAVNQLCQQSTTVYTVCGSCSKPLARSGWLCERCRMACVCAICHQVVRGLITWCHGCGHGGHLTHLNNWFEENSQCPTGCGHQCEIE